jgi:hypothetical protein
VYAQDKEQEEDAYHMGNICNMEAEAHMQGISEPLDFNHLIFISVIIYITMPHKKTKRFKTQSGGYFWERIIQQMASYTSRLH